MYYLLENGKIVDRLSIREDLDLPFEVDFYVQKDEIVLTIDHIHFEHISIIKKVENVYDLIEVGDLLKIKQPKEALERYAFGEYNEQKNSYTSYIKDCFPNKIRAIYKPNSNGDYIKVWEVKENV